jgi:CBS domain-containing protein
MRAGELCVRDVVTALSDETVVDVARRMASLDVGDVIVIEERIGRLPRPIGIVTDRDLVVHVLARPERVPATTTLADIIQRELVTAGEDDDVQPVLDKMRAHVIRRIPIIDRDGGLQGVLSIDDVIGMLRADIETATKLLDIQGQGPLHRMQR